MSDDRRTTFRAPLAETREAVLIAPGQRLRVRIVEESSGGLSVATIRDCPFANGSRLRLSTDDGDVSAVEIIHCRKAGRRTIIGLRRIDVAAKSDRAERRGMRPLILLVGLTLGLYAGFAFRVETIRAYASSLPSLAKILIGT